MGENREAKKNTKFGSELPTERDLINWLLCVVNCALLVGCQGGPKQVLANDKRLLLAAAATGAVATATARWRLRLRLRLRWRRRG